MIVRLSGGGKKKRKKSAIAGHKRGTNCKVGDKNKKKSARRRPQGQRRGSARRSKGSGGIAEATQVEALGDAGAGGRRAAKEKGEARSEEDNGQAQAKAYSEDAQHKSRELDLAAAKSPPTSRPDAASGKLAWDFVYIFDQEPKE